jgi:GT2 family glycosyltransferase
MNVGDVAVLVVSYNVRAALGRALLSIPAEAHTVVVDNASQDGTPAYVREHFPKVTLCAQADNLGFSQAINRAARLTAAPYLLLLNPDAWLLPGTLPALKNSLDHHYDRCGAWAVGPRQVDDDNRLQLSVGPRPTFWGEACRRLVQRRLDRPHTLGAALVRRALDRWAQGPRAVPWVAGSAIMIRRQHFERIGGFDPKFFLYFEDIDFCLRIGRAGGTVIYDPTITVGHSRGVSAHGAQSLARQAYRDSQQYFAGRHQGRLLAPLMRAWAEHRRGG